jgi:hypothetical protein
MPCGTGEQAGPPSRRPQAAMLGGLRASAIEANPEEPERPEARREQKTGSWPVVVLSSARPDFSASLDPGEARGAGQTPFSFWSGARLCRPDQPQQLRTFQGFSTPFDAAGGAAHTAALQDETAPKNFSRFVPVNLRFMGRITGRRDAGPAFSFGTKPKNGLGSGHATKRA